MQRRPNNNDLSVVTVVEMVTHPNPGPDTDLSVVTVVAMVAESLPSSAHLALAVDLPQALSTCIALAFAAILAFMLAHVLTQARSRLCQRALTLTLTLTLTQAREPLSANEPRLAPWPRGDARRLHARAHMRHPLQAIATAEVLAAATEAAEVVAPVAAR